MNERKSFLHHFGEAVDRYRAERNTNAGEKGAYRPGAFRRFLRWLTPNGGTLLLIAILILTRQVWAEPLLGTTNVPGPSATTVNYQGRLADNAGTPLDGTYGMEFALYDAPAGGNLVWGPESHSAVPVSDGLFSVGLGSQTSGGIPTSVWDGDIYLEVTVGGETLEPRELIRSVPIAGMALTVPDGAIESTHIADQSILGQDLGFKNVFFSHSWDHWFGGANVTATDWTHVDSTHQMVLIQKPTNTRVYCRLIASVRAPSSGSIHLRWNFMGVEVSSSDSDWTTVDSGWVDITNLHPDGQVVNTGLYAMVSGGTATLSRSMVTCAYGP